MDHIGNCKFIWLCINLNNWIPSESNTCWGKSNQIQIILITAKDFLPVFPASERQSLCHSFLSTPRFSNMADPSPSKHFLWKCETLQLSLPSLTQGEFTELKNQVHPHREDCDWRERCCLLGRPAYGMRTGGCWRGGGEKNACIHLRTIYVQTY